jgi:hypothetical protein
VTASLSAISAEGPPSGYEIAKRRRALRWEERALGLVRARGMTVSFKAANRCHEISTSEICHRPKVTRHAPTADREMLAIG